MLTRVELRDFRSYPAASVALGPGFNVFHGPNGAGKTNFLEAVHVLATGRSPRALRDDELVRFGAAGFDVQGVVAAAAGPVALRVSHDRGGSKVARVNGRPVANLGALAARLPAVYFSPDEIGLVNDGPWRRRAFLDQLLCQVRPDYTFHLERYQEVVRQRNAALRDFRSGRASDALLPIWDEQLVEHGAAIVSHRLLLVADLLPLVEEEYARLTGGEGASLRYAPACADDTDACGLRGASRDEARAWLAARVEEVRALERERGFTLVGPHRDDVALRVEGLEARAFASRGQRRCLALALKLAAGAILERAAGTRPVLLLDDVLSELDGERRRRLAALVSEGRQACVTCAERSLLQEIAGAVGNLFRVTKGEIRPEG